MMGGMMGGGMGGGQATLMLGLLRNDQVRNDLGLLEDQEAKLQTLGESARTAMQDLFSGMRDATPEQRQAKMQEIGRKMQDQDASMMKQIQEVLLPQQMQRLKEIRIQVMGARALADPEVQKELGLTDQQKQQLEQIQREAMSTMMGGGAGGGADFRNMSQEERQKMLSGMQDRMRQAQDKVMNVLTADQKQKFESIQGKKLNIDMSQLMRGGMGGRGPGGPGGPGGP
jgi:hypothetical protein